MRTFKLGRLLMRASLQLFAATTIVVACPAGCGSSVGADNGPDAGSGGLDGPAGSDRSITDGPLSTDGSVDDVASGASDGAPTGDASRHESGGGGDSAAEIGPTPIDSGGDGGLDAAQADTGADSPSGSCLAPDGSFAPQPRNCANGDSDCTYFAHQLDCCGSGQYVGVAKSAAAQAAACESMWEAHFPVCGCAAAIPTTDDGNTDVDGAAPQVHCVGSGVTGICRTSLL